MANDKCISLTFIYLLTKVFFIHCLVEKPLNGLGISLVKQIFTTTDGKENIFISPLSIVSTIAMLYHGSNGNTKEELTKALGYSGINENDVKNDWKAIEQNILDSNDGYNISLANGVFASNEFQVLNTYEELLKTYYKANIENINFYSGEALTKINGWVKDKTKGLVDKLFDNLDFKSKLVLLNALYFKGNWLKPFLKEDTKKLNFKNFGTVDTSVDMMNIEKHKFKYSSNELLKAQIIAIPYIGKQLDMFIILPKVGDKESIKNLLNDLTIETLEKFMDSMKKEECDLWLPKFKLESQLLLKDYLTQLGFETIFTAKADLSAINGKTGLYVSQFIHKSVIDVNEEGTEAAAASGADVALFSSLPIDPIEFRVNRPFVYFIRDKRNGVLIFMGIVTNLK